MSVSKALQFMDKKDLECAICLNRFSQPKTLKCMHTYCLQCIQKWVETHGKMKCPTCGQEHDLTKEDLQELTSNTMITQLLDYATTTEDQKPTKCAICDNEPAHHCSTCQLYLCGDICIKQHKIVLATKDHPLYALDKKKNECSSDKQAKCPAHCNTPLEFYCTTCNKSACKQCEHVFHCFQKHKVVPMSTAIDKFNKDAKEVVKLAHNIKDKLTEKLETITKDRSEFESQLKLCRTAIEIQEKNLIKKVQAKSQQLISELESMYEEENVDTEIKHIDLKMTEVTNLIVSLNKMMNKPEERETLRSHKTTINAVKDNFLETDFEQSFHKRITPNFIPSTHLDELMNKEGIGKITTADSMMYEVADDNKEITVTKEETFVVKVSSLAEINPCQLAAILINSSGEQSATEIEYQESGEYKITGKCSMVGDWQMKITAGAEHIKGSPVNIKVEETLEFVDTIDNISDYKEHNKAEKVTDVALDRNGCILVSSNSKDILKFNKSGLFVTRMPLTYMYQGQGTSYDTDIARMHQMGDGHILYSAYNRFYGARTVTMYDDTGKNIKTIRKYNYHGNEYPIGLTVDKESRVLYVADRNDHCVYKFSVDDGSQLGTIGTQGSEVGQMKEPNDVTVTKEGHVIVADFGNNRIQMFDANNMLMRVCIIGCGEEDGKVMGPHCVVVDMDENIIVSSNHKLQLFDKNGVFIKRIDHQDDGLNIPLGIVVISKRPRIVAVANHGANNIKLFKY